MRPQSSVCAQIPHISKEKRSPSKTSQSQSFPPRTVTRRKGICQEWTTESAREGRDEWKLEEEIIDSERRVGQTVDTLLQNQNAATKQEQALQDETTHSCNLKDKPCDYWHTPFCAVHIKCESRADVKCLVVHVNQADRAQCEASLKRRRSKGPKRDRQPERA